MKDKNLVIVVQNLNKPFGGNHVLRRIVQSNQKYFGD